MMQIQTTKLPQNLKNGAAVAKAAPNQQQQDAEAPQDSFATTVKREALGEARHLSNRVSNITGGAGGVVGASLGASAALVGGSIVGMAAGGAVAGPISTIFSSGGWDYISTGLSSVGVGGQIGIGVGLVTLAAGGWVVGDAIGGLAAKPFAYGAGLATGAVKGTLRHLGQEAGALPPLPTEEKIEKPPIVSEKSAFMANTQRALAGVGGLTGLAGGATIGLAVAAGAETLAGIFQGDLGISAITRAGLIGAGIGGAGGAIVGGVGGMKIADMIHGGLNSIAEGSRISQKLLEQDKRGNLMDELRTRLETNQTDFAKEKEAGDTNIANRENALQGRSQELAQDQQILNDKLTNEDGITDARSNELYTNETKRLETYEAKLDGDKAHLDSENVRLTDKEGNIKNLIRQEADDRREAHQNSEQSKYDTRKGGLESREDALQTKETKINDIAADKVKKELDPLRQEAADSRSQASSNRNQASGLRSDAQRLEGQVGGFLAEARSYETQATLQESQNYGLRSEERNLSSRESSLQSDLSSCQSQKRRKEAEEARRREEERRRRDSSRTGGGTPIGGGGGRRDGSRTGGGSSGRRDSSRTGGGTIGGGSSSRRSSSRTGASSGSRRSSSRTGI
jgi:hypothetical protein